MPMPFVSFTRIESMTQFIIGFLLLLPFHFSNLDEQTTKTQNVQPTQEQVNQ